MNTRQEWLIAGAIALSVFGARHMLKQPSEKPSISVVQAAPAALSAPTATLQDTQIDSPYHDGLWQNQKYVGSNGACDKSEAYEIHKTGKKQFCSKYLDCMAADYERYDEHIGDTYNQYTDGFGTKKGFKISHTRISNDSVQVKTSLVKRDEAEASLRSRYSQALIDDILSHAYYQFLEVPCH